MSGVRISMMIDRQFLSTLTQRLQESPAVVLLGPRQVGKTTLALQVSANWPAGSTYLDLERPADRLRLDDADAFLRSQGSKLVILDEIHRMPGLFEILRGIIDERRRDGQRVGCAAVFQTVCWPPMRPPACAGERTLCEVTCSAMCPCSPLACPLKPWAGCGPCWPISRVRFCNKAAWPVAWASAAPLWSATSICWSTCNWCAACGHGVSTRASDW